MKNSYPIKIDKMESELSSLSEFARVHINEITNRVINVRGDINEACKKIASLEDKMNEFSKRLWIIEMQDETSETHHNFLLSLINILKKHALMDPTFSNPDPFAIDPTDPDKKVPFEGFFMDTPFPLDKILKQFPLIIEKAKKEAQKLAKASLTEQITHVREHLRSRIKACPDCKKPFDDLEILFFRSPSWTWMAFCGRAGWRVYCPDCQKDVYFDLTILN